MDKREKAIKGLECCMSNLPCNGCPYWDEDNYCDDGDRLKLDAIALLKEQEPRVMTSVDAVPVVRCKDCVNLEKGYVNHYGFCMGNFVDADDYCSLGVRRDGDA